MNKVLGMNINKFDESLGIHIVNYSSCVFLFLYLPDDNAARSASFSSSEFFLATNMQRKMLSSYDNLAS